MAAPADVTIKDLSGEWTMDKTISDPTESILALQGMGYLKRKVIGLATITLQIHHYADENDPKLLHSNIDQVVTGGIKGTTEHRISDWEPREHEDHVFGKVRGQSRLCRGSKGENGKFCPNVDIVTKTDDEKVKKFLKGEILIDGKDTEGFVADNAGEEYGEGESLFLQSFVESLDNGWTAEQIWGFEVIQGTRYYTRRVVAAKDNKYEMARFVYTFNKPREA
ncbi:hypothetical protein BDV28DRAFT_10240 [Aspergillus coremiiformis]|uniref:Calycin-like protein n=1 Tax=Aspergillus coremiiformis TaxID=138285 RepID=A0A5N6Z5H4_9EURO|nr:hypothetical protein BDV28DRAFT_10240 [Aspergillus coremiiformis]